MNGSNNENDNKKQTGVSLANFQSIVNVGHSKSCCDGCFLDFLNDAHLFGKGSVINLAFLEKLKRLEVLIFERRTRLEQILGASREHVAELHKLGELSPSETDGCAEIVNKIVKEKG